MRRRTKPYFRRHFAASLSWFNSEIHTYGEANGPAVLFSFIHQNEIRVIDSVWFHFINEAVISR